MELYDTEKLDISGFDQHTLYKRRESAYHSQEIDHIVAVVICR